MRFPSLVSFYFVADAYLFLRFQKTIKIEKVILTDAAALNSLLLYDHLNFERYFKNFRIPWQFWANNMFCGHRQE